MIESSEKITVTLDEKHKRTAHLVGTDPKTDLAMLSAIRKAVGDTCDVILDVGLAWDAKTTIRRAKLLQLFHFGAGMGFPFEMSLQLFQLVRSRKRNGARK